MVTICSLSAALSCNIAYRFPIYEMEHLDLAGYLGHTPQSWNTLGTFQDQGECCDIESEILKFMKIKTSESDVLSYYKKIN